MDQLASHFNQEDVAFKNDLLIIRLDGKLVGIRVKPHGLTNPPDPFWPFLMNIQVLNSDGSLYSNEYGFASKKFMLDCDSTKWVECPELLFTVTAAELPALVSWVVDWLERQVAGLRYAPELPIALTNDCYEKVFQKNCSSWRSADVLWSKKARDDHEFWRGVRNLLTLANLDDYDPPTPKKVLPCFPRRLPSYTTPQSPKSWVYGSGVISVIPKNFWLTQFIYGHEVNAQLEVAARNGYIVLPCSWRNEMGWLKWCNTWWYFCVLSGNQRPNLKLIVSKHTTRFGRKIEFTWDWIGLYRTHQFLNDSRFLENLYKDYLNSLTGAQMRALHGTRKFHKTFDDYQGSFCFLEIHEELIHAAFDLIAKHYPTNT